MTLGSIGEFGLIKRLKKGIRLDASVIVGSGDDCAVMRYTKDAYLLMTADMIVEGVDFTDRDDYRLIGRKALAISLSDIAACGGVPRYATVSIACPAKTPLSKLDRLSQGIRNLANSFNVNVVGGDISASSALTVNTTVVGVVERKNLLLRSGARIKDKILVTGKLGGSIHGKHLNFLPRVKIARILTRHFHITSMIDISDGLIQDLGHIVAASQKAALLYAACIPIAEAARGLEDALYSGEDFELLFTASPKEAKAIVKDKRIAATVIGEITSGCRGVRLVAEAGHVRPLKTGGFQHFVTDKQ